MTYTVNVTIILQNSNVQYSVTDTTVEEVEKDIMHCMDFDRWVIPTPRRKMIVITNKIEVVKIEKVP